MRGIMRNVLIQVVVLTVLSFSLPILAGASSVDGITINPDSPTTLDDVYATIDGTFNTPGFTLSSPDVVIVGNNIAIDLYALSPTFPVIQIPDSFSVDASLGFLDAGSYSVTATLYVDGVFEDSLLDSFSVSAVPIPGAAWLVGSGLAGLVGLRKRQRS